MARPGGRAGCSWGCGPAGPGEVRAWLAGLGLRRLGMKMRSDHGSGFPVRATPRYRISDFFFRASVSPSVQWGPEADRSTLLMGRQPARARRGCAQRSSSRYSSILVSADDDSAGDGRAMQASGCGFESQLRGAALGLCLYLSEPQLPLHSDSLRLIGSSCRF